MKKFLAITGIGILVLIALFLIIPLFIANNYKVERTTEINRTKDEVKNYMSDFSRFSSWSPWSEMDSNMKFEIAGESGTVGSTYTWEGNEDVGKGKMEITQVTDDTVHVLLNFKEPFESESKTYYAFENKNGKTLVKWGMEGSMPYPWNIMQLFMSMENQIGKDFNKGLSKLKTAVESLPKPEESVSFDIKTVDFGTRSFIGIMDTVSMDKVQEFYATNLPKTFEYVTQKRIKPAGAPSGLYFLWDEASQQTLMAAAIPVQTPNKIEPPFTSWTFEGNALMVEHLGNYEHIAMAHQAMDAYLAENQLKFKGPAIEEYITDPGEEPDTSKWITHIYYLLE